MRISICGMRPTEFTGTDGNQVSGTTIYYLYENQYVEGYAPAHAFVSSNRPNPFKVGKWYDVSYNRYGKFDYNTVTEID